MTLQYRIFRALLLLGLRVFYRDILLSGSEKIPQKKGALLLCNHTNGFIDALLFLSVTKRKVVLIAKASLQKNPFLRFVIWGLGIEVVHRSTDDSSLSAKTQNKATLDRLSRRILDGELICMFPEGKSHSESKMMPFQHGAAKIIAEVWHNDPTVPLIPCALFYSEKNLFRSEVSLSVLSPLLSSHPGFDDLERRPITQAIQDEIALVIPQFKNSEEAGLAQWLSGIIAEKDNSTSCLPATKPIVSKKLELLQRMARGLDLLEERSPEEKRELLISLKEEKELLEKSPLCSYELFISPSKTKAAIFLIRELEIIFLGGAISIFGIAFFLTPYLCTRSLVRRYAPEDDQVATQAVFLGVPIFLFWSLLCFGIGAFYLSPAWLLLMVIVISYSFFVSLLWRDRVQRALQRAITFITIVSGRDTLLEIRAKFLERIEAIKLIEKKL